MARTTTPERTTRRAAAPTPPAAEGPGRLTELRIRGLGAIQDATLELGPGRTVRYAHIDAHTADHAPLDEVLAALG